VLIGADSVLLGMVTFIELCFA